MPKIYDTFLFGGELDMLECRLYELQDTPVYQHVIIESPVTFTGRPKPLAYADNQDRFARWKDRIRYVVPDLKAQDPWGREHESREWARAGLEDAQPDDVIIHADVDEIPLAAAMPAVAEVTGKSKFRARCAVFAVDWELPWPWTAPSVTRCRDLGSVTSLREQDSYTIIDAPAWHLSSIGGPEAIDLKADSFSHTEAAAMIHARNSAGELYERGIFWGTQGGQEGRTQLTAREVDESWPRWIYERRCPSKWFRPRDGLS